MRKRVLTVTVAKIEDHLVVDPSLEEETVADALLTMAFSEDGLITGIQKSGMGTFKREHLKKAMELAKNAYKSYISQISQFLARS